MGNSRFPRSSSFGQQQEPGPPPRPTPGVEDIGQSPTQRLAKQQLAQPGATREELEHWYQKVAEWCHPATRRLSSADFASVPLDDLEELRDELYSRLH